MSKYWIRLAKYGEIKIENADLAKFQALQESEHKFIAWLGKSLMHEYTTLSDAIDEADLTNEILKSAKITYNVN